MIIDVSNTLPQIHFEEMSHIDLNDTGKVTENLPKWASLAGWSQQVLSENLSKYSLNDIVDELIGILRITYSFENFMILINENHIKYHAIHLADFGKGITDEITRQSSVSRIMKAYPNRFLGFAGFNPHKGSKSLRAVRNAITLQGFKAVVINPAEHGIPANHRKYYPIYALCEEYNIPIWIQSDINYSDQGSALISHPKYLEDPLLDFKNLKIIVGHGAWPWLDEMTVLLLKYKNLMVDTSGFTAANIAENTTGWQSFLHYANTKIGYQILFGSEWLVSGSPIQQKIQEVGSWPIDSYILERIYWGNAAELFNLE